MLFSVWRKRRHVLGKDNTSKTKADNEESLLSHEASDRTGKKAPPHFRVTSKDIARFCNVSQATVSYVLNNKPGIRISEETRSRILAAAKAMKYVPNQAARGMRQRSAHSIGVVVGRNMMNVGFNHILKGIKQTLDANGYSITLLKDPEFDAGSTNALPEYLEYIRAGRIDGIAFCFYNMTKKTTSLLHHEGIPYILVSDDGISTDNRSFGDMLRQSVSLCVDFCMEKCFKNICFFSFKNGSYLFSRKYDMFAEIAKEKQADFHIERKIIQIKESRKKNAADRSNDSLKKEILSHVKAGGFDLALTPHQRLGILVQSAIMENRLSIPQYPKHICLDVTHMMQMIYPSVTSFDIPLTEIGEKGGEQLLRIIRGESPLSYHFDFSLKHGVSTM